MNKHQENYFIDFLRFIFSFCIVFYHSWAFTGEFGMGFFNFGFLAVDFYFIVTGYLMINSICKKKNNNISVLKRSSAFVFKKFKELFPALLVTFAIGLLFVYGKSIFFNFKMLLSNELLPELLQMGILNYNLPINSSWWYLSAMFLVLAILYPLASKNTDEYCRYIAPLLIVLILGFVKSYEININDPMNSTFIFRNGFYKALIFIPLGNISYAVASEIRSKKISKRTTMFLTIFEIILYIILILNLNYLFINTFLYALLLMFNISLTFSEITYTNKIFKTDIWKKLGTYGFYMFLCNVSIRTYVINHFMTSNFSYKRLFLIFVAITMVVSLIIYIIVEILYKKIFKLYILKTIN